MTIIKDRAEKILEDAGPLPSPRPPDIIIIDDMGEIPNAVWRAKKMDNNYTVLWNIIPVLSGGKKFYGVQKVLHYGLGGQTVTVVDYFDNKEDAVLFVENQPDGKHTWGGVRWWNRSHNNG